MSEHDGGPVFPRSARLTVSEGGNSVDVEFGCGSLRDWFAGQALPFCLSEFGGNAEDQRQYAEAAYQIADSMLAERERKP